MILVSTIASMPTRNNAARYAGGVVQPVEPPTHQGLLTGPYIAR